MSEVRVYKHEVFEFLNSIGRLDAIIPEEEMNEIHKYNYQISGNIGQSISILKGATIIKTLRLEDLMFDNLSFSIVPNGCVR